MGRRVFSSALVLGLALVGTTPAVAADGLMQELGIGGKFLPKDWASGYVDFSVAPPHNEIDLNRCASATGATGGTNASCSAFARYAGTTYLELRPFGSGLLHHFFVFGQPNLFMGRNVPQLLYTSAAVPIALERTVGFGVDLRHNLQLRLTNHRTDWMGHYNGNLGVADLGGAGPYGMYTTVSARWYFGGYRHHEE